MRRAFICIILLLTAVIHSAAQGRQITLVDDASGSAIEAAYIAYQVLGSPDSTEKGIVTNEKGVATINTPGTLVLEITHLSYQPLFDTMSASTQSVTYKMTAGSFMLDDLVITGQYKPENPKNSLYSVKVINAETIKKRGANNVRELLSQELNVRVTNDNILGSGMTLMGLGGEQVKYMLDGVPIVGRVNGDIDISQLNLNDVERIEVIEGPVSVLYGTNALAGVVNIITKTDQQDKINASVNGYYESVGNYNFDAMAGFRKKNHYLSFSGGRYFFDGFTTDESNRDLPWNPKEQYFGTIKYGFNLKGGLRFLFSSNLFNEKITNRGSVRQGVTVYAFDDYYRTFRNINSLTISGKVFKNHYLNQVLSYSHFTRKKNTYRKDLTTLIEDLVSDISQHDTTRFKAGMARGFLSRAEDKGKFNYQLGYDINIEYGSGQKIEDGSQLIGDYAMFASIKYRPVDMFVIQPGVRFSYNTAYKAPVTPSVHIKLNPVERLTIRASYARGFRAPSIKELYFDFYDINHDIYGNSNLEAEYSNNVNLGVDYTQSFQKKQVIKVAPGFFFNYIKNDIELVPDFSNEGSGTNQPYTYANFSSNRLLGASINITYQYNQILRLSVSSSYIGRNYQFNDSLRSSGYVFSPEASVSASYLIPKAEIWLSAFYKFNGQFITPYLSANNEVNEQVIEPYNLLDITLSRSFWKNRITLSAGVKNLLDVVNVLTSGGNAGAHSSSGALSVGWGRSYFASLKFSFASN